MYAIIDNGGKQYKVAPGKIIKVERLSVEQGGQVKFDRVLLVADQEKVTIGSPVVQGASVLAEALGEERGRKVIVYKYKPKVRYRRKKGHRQIHTRLAIKEIVPGEGMA